LLILHSKNSTMLSKIHSYRLLFAIFAHWVTTGTNYKTSLVRSFFDTPRVYKIT